MKRFHINLKVSDLHKSRDYYAALFGSAPTVEKDDYIKWMLDDPFINFSIEPAAGKTGIAHVGIQAENADELATVFMRIAATGGPRFEEGETNCCYAQSQKNWTHDPDDVTWEAFYTDGQTSDYGALPDMAAINASDNAAISGEGLASEPLSERERCC